MFYLKSICLVITDLGKTLIYISQSPIQTSFAELGISVKILLNNNNNMNIHAWCTFLSGPKPPSAYFVWQTITHYCTVFQKSAMHKYEPPDDVAHDKCWV